MERISASFKDYFSSLDIYIYIITFPNGNGESQYDFVNLLIFVACRSIVRTSNIT